MCQTCQEIHVKISAREQLSKATLAVREALLDLRWCDHRLRTFEGRRGALLTVDRIGRRLRLKPHFNCIERICGNGICSHWVREPGFHFGECMFGGSSGWALTADHGHRDSSACSGQDVLGSLERPRVISHCGETTAMTSVSRRKSSWSDTCRSFLVVFRKGRSLSF